MSTAQATLSVIRDRGRGSVFTSRDFATLASRDSVDQTLSRLARAGTLQRVARGVYYYPRVNRALGFIASPDPDQVAAALARQVGARIAPSGAAAANRLGLSMHVPAKTSYLTDAQTRRVTVDGQLYLLKHTTPRNLPNVSPMGAEVFQALRYVGRNAVDRSTITRLRDRLSPKQKQTLARDSKRVAVGWIREAMLQVVHEVEEEDQ